MPRQSIDEEWDRDALFASRNLVSLECAAEQLKVSTHMVAKAAARTHGALLVWVFGTGSQVMRKYRDLYVDIGSATRSVPGTCMAGPFTRRTAG
jgi:hypothetical protein